jgi:fucose permease
VSAQAASPAKLTAAASAGMLLFGLVVALIGALLPFLSNALGVGLAQAGELFVWMNLSMLAAAYALGRLMDRAGLKAPMALGPVLVSAALVALAAAGSPKALVAAACLLGVGGGMLNGATNTLVADLNPDPVRKAAALNRLGVFFGFGAVLMPLAVGSLVRLTGWRLLLVAAAGLSIVAAVYSSALTFPPPKQRARSVPGHILKLLAERFLLLMGLLLFCQSGCEFVLGGFLSSFFTQAKELSPNAASWLLALYWAALMAGRAAISHYLVAVGPVRIMTACALLASASLLALRLPVGLPALVAGTVALGLGVSGVYPTALGLAGAAYPQQSGTVFGILFTFGLTGGMALPWLVGRVGAAAGIGTALLVPAGAFLLIALLAAVLPHLRPWPA